MDRNVLDKRAHHLPVSIAGPLLAAAAAALVEKKGKAHKAGAASGEAIDY